ncbi:hypothetical protein J2S40_004801 [Nocardioides luteus]|uniref:Uncharacterized protein n=1 Tax=Nocardioides luteus TaxID=1844 RepID=A0ABQ5T1Q0_9ACTN|nr:hypothetical protein [Nocardioides luteus]MDR7313743.1 hypothetical protein [Nocardioides luteus]GGR63659.1 hypothetical protein GCM10010197_33750 [Nocardioides luteus]GLJ70408.1 hypothetical protein GCM10017579_44440 [Nocardioides luteus]
MRLSRKLVAVVAAVVAAGVVLLALVGGVLGAVVLGGDDAPVKEPAQELPAVPREGPAVAEVDEDAFAPVGEVGAD